jgi:hypothetical protein
MQVLTPLIRMLLVLALLLIGGAALAQDDALPEGCAINLDASVSLLFMAQRRADQGDGETALGMIRQVNSALEELLNACALPVGTSDTPAVDLPQTFTAADGSFSVGYPDGWTAAEDGAIVIGSDPDSFEDVQASPDALPSGEFAYLMVFESYRGDLEVFTAGYIGDAQGFLTLEGEITPVTVAGREAYHAAALVDGTDIVLDIVFVDATDNPAAPQFFGFIGLAHDNDIATLNATTSAMLASLTLGE